MSNSILDRIEKTLTKLSTEHEVKMEGVFYGACTESKLSKWNYFVFNRGKTTKNNNGTRTDLQTTYEVHIVHEGHVPEGYVKDVIDALQAQDEPGTKLKLNNDDITYDYTFKQNTNMVVEVATITFYHPEKRC